MLTPTLRHPMAPRVCSALDPLPCGFLIGIGMRRIPVTLKPALLKMATWSVWSTDSRVQRLYLTQPWKSKRANALDMTFASWSQPSRSRSAPECHWCRTRTRGRNVSYCRKRDCHWSSSVISCGVHPLPSRGSHSRNGLHKGMMWATCVLCRLVSEIQIWIPRQRFLFCVVD